MGEPELIAALKSGGFPTGVLCDAMGKINNMRYDIKPLFSEAHLAGPAVTVRCPVADNLTIHRAMEMAHPGDVIVVDAGGYKNAGLFGEVMTVSCIARKIAGVIIDGGCRDAAEIVSLKYPLFAAAVNPGGTVKETLGEINVPIQCGGVCVHPNDIMVGDRDGVVCIPREKVTLVLKNAEEIIQREKKYLEELKNGRSTMDVLGFNRIMEQKGLL